MDDRPYDFEIDPASFITVGATGLPGERTFFIQAAQGPRLISLVLEKEQTIALAASIHRLLIGLEHETEDADADEAPPTGMELLMPVEPEYRVVEMGLGVDEDREMIVLVAQESPDDEPGKRLRVYATFEQMRQLARQALVVAESGRPTCPLCGRPIDPEGHFCPRTNGHANPAD